MNAKTWIPYVAAAVFALVLAYSGQMVLTLVGLLIGLSVVLLAAIRFRFYFPLAFGILSAIGLRLYSSIRESAGPGPAYELSAPSVALGLLAVVFDFVLWSMVAMAVASLWRLGRHLLRRRSSNVSS